MWVNAITQIMAGNILVLIIEDVNIEWPASNECWVSFWW